MAKKESKRKALHRLTLDIEEERKSRDGAQDIEFEDTTTPREQSDQPRIERVEGTDAKSEISLKSIANEDDQEKIGDATPPFGSLINIQNPAGIVIFKTRNL